MKEFDELYEIIKYLRSEKGCPWDRQQTSETISFDLVEEAYEVNDAIESKNMEKLREELGDLLFLVLMHIRIKEEEGAFTLGEILANTKEKMIYRHPHVFGDRKFQNIHQLLENWEKTKINAFKTIPDFLPALLQGQKIIEKVRRLNPDMNPEEIYNFLTKNIDELDKNEQEILQALINATFNNKPLEKSLRSKFIKLKKNLAEGLLQ
ncbi:MAG: MazG nucleotide pyrophosphohydrolase domain-containing protein [candidate division WOR-3 bacterium]